MIGENVGHYLILERIGKGGMGDVFQAEDTRLGRRVAMKFLTADHVEDPSALHRFRSEARAVSKLSHPSICTLLDVGEHRGRPYIVMELLQGETLQRRLERGPLEVDVILDVAERVVEALRAAHAADIVHRDIKPANIFITEQGQVKVLDFGLAKKVLDTEQDPEEQTTEASGPGVAVGTVSYMSPEQALGRNVDPRSDLFSVGVLLYEMVTGRRPFEGQTANEIIDAIVHRRPEPVARFNREVPDALQPILDKLLAKFANDRYQTAQGLLTDLRRLTPATASLTSGDAETGWRRRGKARRAISVVVPLVITVAVLWTVFGRDDFSFSRRDWVLVADLENLTEEPLFNDSLDLAFRIALEQSRYANVVPVSQVAQALSRMRRDPDGPVDRVLGMEICQREGIRALVIPSIIKVGSAYRLTVEVVDPNDGSNVFTSSNDAAGINEVLGALEELARQTRGHLGESLAALAENTAPLEKVTTSDLEALKAYSRGVDHFLRSEYEAAIRFFRSAIERDPEFAMAHARLGVAVSNAAGVTTAEARAHWQTALRQTDRLTAFEELYVRGHAARGRPEEEIRIWSLMSNDFSDVAIGHANLGIAYWSYNNDFEAAADAFARAAESRDVRRFMSYHHLGYCQLGLGHIDDAISSFERGWAMEANPVFSGLADAYIVARRYDDAREFLTHPLSSNAASERLEGMIRQASLYLDRGMLSEALKVQEDVTAVASRAGVPGWRGRSLSAQIGILEHSADVDRLRELIERAVDLEKQAIVDERGPRIASALRLALLTMTRARNFGAENAVEALAFADELVALEDFPAWRAYAHAAQGEVALARGNVETARGYCRDAISEASLYQAHGCLARALEGAGEIAAAIAEYEWIIDHRGHAYAEYFNELVGREHNVALWAVAHAELGRLHEMRGDSPAAMARYRELIDHWSEADPNVPALQTAKARLSVLRAEADGLAGAGAPANDQAPGR